MTTTPLTVVGGFAMARVSRCKALVSLRFYRSPESISTSRSASGGPARWGERAEGVAVGGANPTRVRRLALGLLLLHLGLASGCASPEPPPPAATIPQIDKAHVTAVEVRLKGDVELATESIQVVAHGDTVVLSGTVQKDEEKRRAEQLARSVQGVNKVDNQLKVQPPP